jgi:hypothetical protein
MYMQNTYYMCLCLRSVCRTHKFLFVLDMDVFFAVLWVHVVLEYV